MAIELEGETTTFFKGKGIALFQLQRYEEALAVFDHFKSLVPSDRSVVGVVKRCWWLEKSAVGTSLVDRVVVRRAI